MKTRVLILLLVVGVYQHHLFATEPFDFVADVIRSFGNCKIASAGFKGIEDADVTSLMRTLLVFTHEMRIAHSAIEPHIESENELLRETANNFSFVYLSIIKNHEELLDFIEQTLNDLDDAVSQQGTRLRRVSENTARNEELWRMLIDVVVMTAYTLVDQTRTEEGQLRFLTITGAERDSLRSALLRVFGESVTEGIKAGQLPVDGSGGLLWEFLARPWKTTDER